jgi:hypothetical protein
MNTEPFESYNEDLVWSTEATARAFMNQAYENVTGMYAGKVAIESWTPNSMSYNGFSTNDFPRDMINRYYANDDFNQFAKLRKCNMIIEKMELSTTISPQRKKEMAAEAYMLRAMIYYYQTLRMGRFVPINKMLTPSDTEDFRTPLTDSPENSYKLILTDIDKAIEGLPASAPSGLINIWIAKAFKSRVCLSAYAYTGNASYIDKCIEASDDVIKNSPYRLDPDYGNMFLEKGKNSNEIIFAIYRSEENTNTTTYSELANMVPNVTSDRLIQNSCSPAFNNLGGESFEGWHFYSPTQNLVDEYLVFDEEDGKAKAWDQTSQFLRSVVDDLNNVNHAAAVGSYTKIPLDVPNNDDMGTTSKGNKIIKAGKVTDNSRINELMYQNRDKRFYGTIIYDSCIWLSNELMTTCCNGNGWGAARGDGHQDSYHTTSTNYYWRKGVYDNLSPRFSAGQKLNYHVVLIRLGEVYLNKAEALLLKNQVTEAVALLNVTREIHGELPPSEAGSSQEAWIDYKRERRVELALENDFYWSLLRWGKYGGDANGGESPGGNIAELNEPVYKIQITKDRKRFFIGQVISYFGYDRNFSVKRYLLPIPQGQLDKRAASGIIDTQNPGW